METNSQKGSSALLLKEKTRKKKKINRKVNLTVD
jgi:hypothetical protein